MRRRFVGRSAGMTAGSQGEQGFWPSYADMMSAVALILFFLMLLSYIQNLITGNDLRSTRDVLDRLGYSEEEFLDACRRQFRQFFIDENSSIPENLRKQYGYYDALEQVDSELYVSMDLAAFPSETGDLVVAAPIVSLAGAAFYWHLIYLGMGNVG